MLMVVFGAGASFDSSLEFLPPYPRVARQNVGPSQSLTYLDPEQPWRPPLTNDLFRNDNDKFGNIVERYARLHGILPFLRQPQNDSVEQQLELYLNQASADQERARQLLSVRYYLHDLFRTVSDNWLSATNGVTNYAMLLEQIRHANTASEPVCLVTFNYDRLLDHALLPSRVNSQPLERDFDAHPMFKLLKPHGSVEWARVLDPVPYYKGEIHRSFAPQQLIDQAASIKLSDQFVRANATDPAQLSNFKQPIVPAIATPVQTKTDDFFEWPSTHRAYFEELLPHVRKILIIGWQGKEAHFLKLLRERLPSGGVTQITHLQVVGRDSTEASDISKQFIAGIRRDVKKLPTAAPAQGFSEFVRGELVNFFFKD